MSEKIVVEVVCKSCKGTGLYQGMAERDGAFIQCWHCKGTGCVKVSYELFEKRKPQPKCKRVYLSGGGYGITDKDITTSEGRFMPFSKYGCTYEEWLDGKIPEHIKFLGCPMCMDKGACHDIDGFVDKCHILNGKYLSSLRNCKHQCYMEECWERFEKGKIK